MTNIKLYSTPLCPFAHRVRLTLAEKAIPFELIEIDLQNKPADFKAISPSGKVPVLKQGNRRVWESTIINEYLEEAFPNPPLLPQDPFQRARARIWINFADTRLFTATGKLLYLSQNAQQQAEAKQQLIEHLRFMEEGLQQGSENSPYWMGSAIGLVDFTFYPVFEQWVVLEQFRDMPFPPELRHLKRWWEAVAERKSVRAIAKAPEFYLERYGQLAQPMVT